MKACTVEFYTEFQEVRFIYGVYTDVNRAITAMIRAYIAGQGAAHAIISHFELDEPGSLVKIEYSFGYQGPLDWAERHLGVDTHEALEKLSDKEVYTRFMKSLA